MYKKAKKRKNKHSYIPNDTYGKAFAKSVPILNNKDIRTELSKPIESSVHAKSTTHTHLQIINGVVCSTGRYSRLHEDYDDR
ncbi:MAG: hypothetical protein K2H35_02930 [Muribaculaceae bacterium]|nr:hypothetical protein [Muribaculaceae bacterium]